MKHKLLALGLIVLSMVAFGTSPAGAASVAGPYYATPSWDQKLDASTRFIVLTNWGSAAVLDRETGLVWEQSPSTSTFPWSSDITPTAALHCNRLTTGGRLGWRLPTIQELASLVDPSVPFPGPTLPVGHPFSVQSSFYWSATTDASSASHAWGLTFVRGGVDPSEKGYGNYVWCVRGGQGVDPQ